MADAQQYVAALIQVSTPWQSHVAVIQAVPRMQEDL